MAEIVGCYLPYLWLRKDKSPLLLVPAALSLVAFVWLLTLHPTGAARSRSDRGRAGPFGARFPQASRWVSGIPGVAIPFKMRQPSRASTRWPAMVRAFIAGPRFLLYRQATFRLRLALVHGSAHRARRLLPPGEAAIISQPWRPA